MNRSIIKLNAVILGIMTTLVICSCREKGNEPELIEFSRIFLQEINQSNLENMETVFIDIDMSIKEIDDSVNASGLFGYIVNISPGGLQDIAWSKVAFIRNEATASIMAVPLLSNPEFLLYFAVVKRDEKWRIGR